MDANAVVARIVGLMERGVMPWRTPWAAVCDRNAASGRPYHGINRLALLAARIEASRRGEEWRPLWLTFRQAKELGGTVCRGQHGTQVVLSKQVVVEDEETGEQKVRRVFRAYTVFNVAQCAGIDVPEGPAPSLSAPQAVWDSWEAKPRLIEADHACYDQDADAIFVPPLASFADEASYWAVLFHESIHATAHPRRLGRDLSRYRDDIEERAFEELVAEIGAAFIASACGILDATADASAAYCDSWLAAVRSRPGVLFSAASEAERAARSILPGQEWTVVDDGQKKDAGDHVLLSG